MAREPRNVGIWVDWYELGGAMRMGVLRDEASRGKEVFSFEYDRAWLDCGRAHSLDPTLGLFRGRQYLPAELPNFGVFLDSSPDRWGRTLMDRREAQRARDEGQRPRALLLMDYLLGVYDGHRMGALRFRIDEGPFLDDDAEFASPPWTSLRELEQASLALEQDDAEREPTYAQSLRMLFAPGSSLGGARPKASVLDAQKQLWIAKFPSRQDRRDIGAWEGVVHTLARRAGLMTTESICQRFASNHHTFLTRRFDRRPSGGRIHFASAMTLLQHNDGDGGSYLELAQFLIQQGSQPTADLEQLWHRIVFFLCISNVDDHLRNHGFLLNPSAGGWSLSPAYDMNPVPDGTGLALNISETDNALSLELALDVATSFRLKPARAREIVAKVQHAVRDWRSLAQELGLTRDEQDRMAPAFALADI